MKILNKYGVLSAAFVLALTGCAQNIEVSNGQSQWDFDHNLQFSETKLSDNTYHIEVIPNDKTRFSILATFLMRKSLRLCRSYGFKLEMLKGIETYDHKRSFPNLIVGRLAANLECPSSSTK
jgi:hypothetical protein